MRALVPLGTPVAAGLAGAGLTLAGVRSPLTEPLTLLFVLFTPAVCVALLLPGLDALARWIVAGTASVVLAASVAEVMLVTAGWSPRGGVAATGIICAGLAAAVLVLHRHRPGTRKTPPPTPRTDDAPSNP